MYEYIYRNIAFLFPRKGRLSIIHCVALSFFADGCVSVVTHSIHQITLGFLLKYKNQVLKWPWVPICLE